MAFRKMSDYNDERFKGLFLLRNDGDYADVVFLYRDINDVLIADTHYIKSSEYSGYVHCAGVPQGCPACGKNIRVQTKLFIPLYNINDRKIQFWDRNIRFENQLNSDVFEKYPNPCDYVFRITRHGVSGDINTTYQITAVGRNTMKSYDQILQDFNIKMPDHYSTVCREVSIQDMNRMLNSNPTEVSSSEIPDYKVTPRVSAVPEPTYAIEEDEVIDDFDEDSLKGLDEDGAEVNF